MTEHRKTSEELIRQARSRYGLGDVTSAPSTEEDSDVVDDLPSGLSHGEPKSPPPSEGTVDEPARRAGPIDDPTTTAPGPVETAPSRRPFFTTRWFRLLALVVVGLGYGFFTSLDDANRDVSGEIVSGGDLDVMNVQPGDCFDDPGSGDEVVFQLEAVPCSEPHDNEVFAVESVSGAFGSEYPGRQSLEEHAYEVCSGPVFDSYVGTSYLDSSLDVFTLTPTDDSWSQGDRDVVCVLYKLDFTKLNGPARNSGL